MGTLRAKRQSADLADKAQGQGQASAPANAQARAPSPEQPQNQRPKSPPRLKIVHLPPKKERILALYREEGVHDIVEIADRVPARPSYVAQVLQREGLIGAYFDLYTGTSKEQNVYSRYFKNVLSFKSVEAAERSIARIDELYLHFERNRDRAGQHQAMIIALTGYNRARWSGKSREAQVFAGWLSQKLGEGVQLRRIA